MGKLKSRLREKLALATGHVAAKEGANGYVGDNPHEAQATNASSGTNTEFFYSDEEKESYWYYW